MGNQIFGIPRQTYQLKERPERSGMSTRRPRGTILLEFPDEGRMVHSWDLVAAGLHRGSEKYVCIQRVYPKIVCTCMYTDLSSGLIETNRLVYFTIRQSALYSGAYYVGFSWCCSLNLLLFLHVGRFYLRFFLINLTGWIVSHGDRSNWLFLRSYKSVQFLMVANIQRLEGG